MRAIPRRRDPTLSPMLLKPHLRFVAKFRRMYFFAPIRMLDRAPTRPAPPWWTTGAMEPLRMLTPILPELRDALGTTAAELMVGLFGGVVLRVPRQVHRNDALALLLCPKPAAALARMFGGREIRVPSRDWKREAIVELRRKGRTADDIAAVLGINERRVWEVIAEVRREALSFDRRPSASTPAPARAGA
jgi:hypothetical protein